MDKFTVTGRINAKVFELFEQHPEGLHWSELLSKIEVSDRSFHPKTVNGCVWKLVERFPDKVYKPSKGLFRLLKYKSKSNNEWGQKSEKLNLLKLKKMKLDKSFYFLRPRLLNVFLTILVLCLPFLREQYNQGQYVTWYRPIVVIFNLQNLQQPKLLLITTLFVFIIYFLVSLALVGLSKFILPILKRYRWLVNFTLKLQGLASLSLSLL